MLGSEIDKLQEKTEDLGSSIAGYVYTKRTKIWRLIDELETDLNGEYINLKRCADILQSIIDRIEELSILVEIIAADKETNFDIRKEKDEALLAVMDIAKKLMVIIYS